MEAPRAGQHLAAAAPPPPLGDRRAVGFRRAAQEDRLLPNLQGVRRKFEMEPTFWALFGLVMKLKWAVYNGFS